jgi:hypothetical protein
VLELRHTPGDAQWLHNAGAHLPRGIPHARNNTPPPVTLNLERGCIEHDRANDLILLRGKHFKGVQLPIGAEPDGEQRPDPWVVVEPVVTAVTVVQRLHEVSLLFPNILLVNDKAGANALKTRATDAARTSQQIFQDINAMIDWVIDYCRAHRRGDAILPDPARLAISWLSACASPTGTSPAPLTAACPRNG